MASNNDKKPDASHDSSLMDQLSTPQSPVIEPRRSDQAVVNGNAAPSTPPTETKEAPAPTPPAAPAKKEKVPKETTWIKPLRTYKADAEQALKTGDSTLTSMVLAEKAKRMEQGVDTTVESNKKPKGPKIMIAISAILVIIGLGSLISLLFIGGDDGEKTPIAVTAGTIFTEEQQKVTLLQETRQEASQKIATIITGSNLLANQIKEIFFVKKELVQLPESTETVEREVSVNFPELLTILDSRVPSALLRSLDRDFVFGIHTFAGNNPFLILSTQTYSNAFSHMLLWEPAMLDDLTYLFALVEEDIAGKNIFFEDVVIKNQDVRVARDQNDEDILFYTFVDQEKLIITTNEITLDEIIQRIKRPQNILR